MSSEQPSDIKASPSQPSSALASPVAKFPVEAVKEEVQKQVTHAFGVQVGIGNPPNSFVEKLQPQHIDKILDYTKSDKDNDHRQAMTFFVGTIVAILILCGMFLYAGKDAMLEKILALIVGFGGGFGVGKASGKK